MIGVARSLGTGPGLASHREEVAPVQAVEQGPGVGVASQVLRQLGSDRGQQRRAQQQVAQRGIGGLQQLAREVGEDRFARGAIEPRTGWIAVVVARARQHQDQACNPAIAHRVQALDVGVRADTHNTHDLRSLFEMQAQVLGADRRDLPVGLALDQLGRKLMAAQRDQADARRDLVDRTAQQGRETFTSGPMAVVEHDAGVGGEPLVEPAEELPIEAGQVGQVLGGQIRQGDGMAVGSTRERDEIGDRGRRIAIAFVDMKPEGGRLACAEVVRDQRGLAAPRRAADPDARRVERCVQTPEKTLSRRHRREPRASQLRQYSRAFGHSLPAGGD